MDFDDFKEKYGCQTIFLIVLITGIVWYYFSNKEEQNIKKVDRSIRDMRQSTKKLQDTLFNIDANRLKEKYDAIEVLHKDVEFSFQIEEHIKNKNIFIDKMIIEDIEKIDTNYYIYTQDKLFLYKIKASYDQIKEITDSYSKLDKKFAIVRVEKVGLYFRTLYKADEDYGEYYVEKEIDLDVSKKYKSIEGILVDFASVKN